MTQFRQAVCAVLTTVMIAGITGCGESEQAKPVAKPAAPQPAPMIKRTVGGSVSGLPGSGLVLQLNGGNDLPVSANGKFDFPVTLPRGSKYAVTVKSSPTSPVKQTCTVGQGDGNIANVAVTNIVVACITNSYAVGGTVSGLTGKGLVLQLNGAHELPIMGNGKFVFPGVRLPDGSDYSVAIKRTPARRKCTIKAVSKAFDSDTLNIAAVSCSKKGRRR